MSTVSLNVIKRGLPGQIDEQVNANFKDSDAFHLETKAYPREETNPHHFWTQSDVAAFDFVKVVAEQNATQAEYFDQLLGNMEWLSKNGHPEYKLLKQNTVASVQNGVVFETMSGLLAQVPEKTG